MGPSDVVVSDDPVLPVLDPPDEDGGEGGAGGLTGPSGSTAGLLEGGTVLGDGEGVAPGAVWLVVLLDVGHGGRIAELLVYVIRKILPLEYSSNPTMRSSLVVVNILLSSSTTEAVRRRWTIARKLNNTKGSAPYIPSRPVATSPR
jgi:hypothetical protein